MPGQPLGPTAAALMQVTCTVTSVSFPACGVPWFPHTGRRCPLARKGLDLRRSMDGRPQRPIGDLAHDVEWEHRDLPPVEVPTTVSCSRGNNIERPLRGAFRRPQLRLRPLRATAPAGHAERAYRDRPAEPAQWPVHVAWIRRPRAYPLPLPGLVHGSQNLAGPVLQCDHTAFSIP
jgi:hypothetical protein